MILSIIAILIASISFQTTGNSGTKLGCCVITEKYDDSDYDNGSSLSKYLSPYTLYVLNLITALMVKFVAYWALIFH